MEAVEKLAAFLAGLPPLPQDQEPTFKCLGCMDTGFDKPRKAADGFRDVRPCLRCRQGCGIMAGIWWRRVYSIGRGGRNVGDSDKAREFAAFLKTLPPQSALIVAEVFEAAKG